MVTYSLSQGGLQRMVANSTFLFQDMGYEVHLYVLESRIDYPFVGTLHKYESDTLNFVSKIKVYLKIFKSLKSNNFDFIIDHRYRLNPLTEVLWQKIIYRNKVIVNYVHSSNIYNYLFNSNRFNCFLFQNRYFLCVSKGVENIMNQKFPELKTKTIYNIVNVEKSDISTANELLYIVSIARMDESNVKQIDILLECYAKSILPSRNIRLMIIGDGVRLEEMKALVHQLKISHLVDFKGFVVNPYPYLNQALFTVLTSKYEGLPTVLIESLACGTPVISFDCESGPNEIIDHEVNGLLVENQNFEAFKIAMKRMVLDTELYNSCKKNSQNKKDLHSFEKIMEDWKVFLKVN